MSDYTVRVFKLISGQEIVGKCKPEVQGISVSAPDKIIMSHVRQIAPMQTPGGWQLSLVPFFVVSPDGEINMWKLGIVAELKEVPDPLEKEYLSAVSGIQLVGAGSSLKLPSGK